MKLRTLLFADFAEKIRREQKKIIVYGAGMIGQIVVPDIIRRFGLDNEVCFYVDADKTKQGKRVETGISSYEIKSAEVLKKYCALNKNTVLLITNSRLYSVIEELDKIDELEDTEAYIVPVMQLAELKRKDTKLHEQKKGDCLIPKVIHYCWFSGKEIPDHLKKCMESWEKYCPDYEIKRWDETNYDMNRNPYVRQAYECQKWGFIPDYARLDILYHYGGIYMDTDVELVKSPDVLCCQQAFCGVEKWGNINIGGLSGAIPHHPMMKKLLDERKDVEFIRKDGSLNTEPSGIYETMPFIREGMRIDNRTQNIQGMTVYSSDYFHPYDYMSGEIFMTENTFSIHYFDGGWLSPDEKKYRTKPTKRYRKLLDRMKMQ